jgi:hypothetical protein
MIAEINALSVPGHGRAESSLVEPHSASAKSPSSDEPATPGWQSGRQYPGQQRGHCAKLGERVASAGGWDASGWPGRRGWGGWAGAGPHFASHFSRVLCGRVIAPEGQPAPLLCPCCQRGPVHMGRPSQQQAAGRAAAGRHPWHGQRWARQRR